MPSNTELSRLNIYGGLVRKDCANKGSQVCKDTTMSSRSGEVNQTGERGTQVQVKMPPPKKQLPPDSDNGALSGGLEAIPTRTNTTHSGRRGKHDETQDAIGTSSIEEATMIAQPWSGAPVPMDIFDKCATDV